MSFCGAFVSTGIHEGSGVGVAEGEGEAKGVSSVTTKYGVAVGSGVGGKVYSSTIRSPENTTSPFRTIVTVPAFSPTGAV